MTENNNENDNFQKKPNINNQSIKEEEGFLEVLYKNKKAIIKKLITIIMFIIAINVSVFVSVWLQQCSNSKVHTKAKIYMSSAAVINIMYIYPIYKCFGWGNDFSNIIVFPFCIIRNFLYHQGLKNIPEDDGEREVWWFVIRFTEYDKFVTDTAYKMHTIHAHTVGYRTYDKIKQFNDEVYEHILKLATLKIKDEYLKSRRYNMVVITLDEYHTGIICSIPRSKKDLNLRYKNRTQNEKFETLLNLFIKQTEYIKREEPEAYDYFKNHTYNYYLEDYILVTYASSLIESDLIQKNIMDLNIDKKIRLTEIGTQYFVVNKAYTNKYLNIYGDAKSRLILYLNDYTLSQKEKSMIDFICRNSTIDEILAKLCPNNPHLKSLRDAVKG